MQKILKKEWSPLHTWGVYWKQVFEQAVYSEWMKQLRPDSLTMKVEDVKFLTVLEAATNPKTGRFRGSYGEYPGFSRSVQKEWDIFGDLFQMHISNDMIYAEYSPKVSVSLEIDTDFQLPAKPSPGSFLAALPVRINEAFPQPESKIFLAAGNYKIFSDYVNFDILEDDVVRQVGVQCKGGKLLHIVGNPIIEEEEPMEFDAPYGKDAFDAALNLVTYDDLQTVSVTLLRMKADVMVREDLITIYDGHVLTCNCLTQQELSWLPENMKKEAKSLLGTRRASSESALWYIQQILDDNYDAIKRYAKGKKSSSDFYGYCAEISSHEVCGPNGNICLDWHDIPSQEIPAAWDALQTLVACSEYPFTMWRDTV